MRSEGSSPRVRGKPASAYSIDTRVGLIPACAGKTLPLLLLLENNRAHPRVCGENVPILFKALSTVGSSPRVRGKHYVVSAGRITQRLIPACAGKTTGTAFLSIVLSAHPRVCGENGGDPKKENTTSGSSPRVRGKPPQPISWLTPQRLIPACAGKTTRTATR